MILFVSSAFVIVGGAFLTSLLQNLFPIIPASLLSSDCLFLFSLRFSWLFLMIEFWLKLEHFYIICVRLCLYPFQLVSGPDPPARRGVLPRYLLVGTYRPWAGLPFTVSRSAPPRHRLETEKAQN